MVTIRRSEERGHAERGWLKSYHTFSFADYYDPQHMSFGPLRVINEDWVAPGQGFGMHPHRDMEIITYVLDGVLEHKDSLGTAQQLHPGEVQRMTAGSGIVHSEYNGSDSEEVHLLQIWIMPERPGLKPGYEQKSFAAEIEGGLALVASPDARDGAVKIHQNAEVYAGKLPAGKSVEHALGSDRRAWVQVARGSVFVNGTELRQGDAAGLEGETAVQLKTEGGAEVLLFDLP